MRPVKIAPPAAAAGSHTPTMPQSGNSNRAPRFSGTGRRSHHIALILYGAHDAHGIVGSDAASTSAGLALGHSPPPAPDPGAGERPVPAASPYHAPSPYPSTFSYAVSRPAALSPLLLRPLRGLLPLAAHEALSLQWILVATSSPRSAIVQCTYSRVHSWIDSNFSHFHKAGPPAPAGRCCRPSFAPERDALPCCEPCP